MTRRTGRRAHSSPSVTGAGLRGSEAQLDLRLDCQQAAADPGRAAAGSGGRVRRPGQGPPGSAAGRAGAGGEKAVAGTVKRT